MCGIGLHSRGHTLTGLMKAWSAAWSFGRQYYYSDPKHNCLQPHQVRSTLQGGGGKMLIWGCIAFFRPGEIPGSMERWIQNFSLPSLTIMFWTHSLGTAWILRNRSFSKTTLGFIRQTSYNNGFLSLLFMSGQPTLQTSKSSSTSGAISCINSLKSWRRKAWTTSGNACKIFGQLFRRTFSMTYARACPDAWGRWSDTEDDTPSIDRPWQAWWTGWFSFRHNWSIKHSEIRWIWRHSQNGSGFDKAIKNGYKNDRERPAG